MSLFAELLMNHRALVVYYEGRTYFPTYTATIPGTFFGLPYDYETNYLELKKSFAGTANFVFMPAIPHGPYDILSREGVYPPFPPGGDLLLGSDHLGRDLLVRLVYGFRTAMLFSLALLAITYSVGIVAGVAMGYYGGWTDLIAQRILEIWNNVPFLYVVMIIASVFTPGFWTLLLLLALFGWMNISSYLRTETFRERGRSYVLAARILGASDRRIVLRHILPNCLSIVLSFAPFSLASGIVAIVSLDFLGFGLPVPTPSWGEILQQGLARLDAPWLVISVVVAMTSVLTLVTFVGEGMRETFDPKAYTFYEG